MTITVAGVVVGVVAALLICLLIVFIVRRRRRRSRNNGSNQQSSSKIEVIARTKKMRVPTTLTFIVSHLCVLLLLA
jgi:hypothetical protein